MLILKRLHFWFGLVGIIIFLLTGQYMAHIVGDMSQIADGSRMLYRSAHIYLMLVSILNLFVGFYMEPANILRMVKFQYLLSLLLLVSLVLILYGFFFESQNASPDRPLVSLGMFALFGAAVLLVLVKLLKRAK